MEFPARAETISRLVAGMQFGLRNHKTEMQWLADLAIETDRPDYLPIDQYKAARLEALPA